MCDILCVFPKLRIEATKRKVTLINLQQKLKRRVEAAALDLFGIELEQIPAETPPKPELGDFAFPVAFELPKRSNSAPG